MIRQFKQSAMGIAAGPDSRPGWATGHGLPGRRVHARVDFVLLVTEPTPFGLHDLRLAVQVARDELRRPIGVLINRDGVGDQGVEEYCRTEKIPVLMRIPLDRRIAEAYSDGLP